MAIPLRLRLPVLHHTCDGLFLTPVPTPVLGEGLSLFLKE
jgi:hypothetical protein